MVAKRRCLSNNWENDMSIVRSEKSATPLCQTMHERFFVEALLLHCRQKWKEAPGALIKMTHDQGDHRRSA